MASENKPYTIKHSKLKKANDSLCVFVSFSYGNAIQEYVYYYLNEIKKANFDIVFVSSSALDETSVQNLKKYASLVIEKTNEGLDFASWQIGLLQINFGRNYKNVLLANDSVFGPFYDLKSIIDFADRSEYDMFGMTDNHEINYHLQSYFLYFKSSIINSQLWVDFWNSIKVMDDKKQIIVDYEIGLSQYMLKHGFKLGAYCSYDIIRKDLNLENSYNSALAFYSELIRNYKFPFLKRELLIREDIPKLYAHHGMIIDTFSWKSIILNYTKYPTELIDNYIEHYFNFITTTDTKFTINKLKNKNKIIFITHNASLSGAPIVFLDFLKWFKENTKWEFEIIVRDTGYGGDFLLPEFEKLGTTSVFLGSDAGTLDSLRFRLFKKNVGLIFSNTLVNSDVEQFLSILNCPQVCYIHELEYVINAVPSILSNIKWQIKRNAYIIACTKAVKDNLVLNHGAPEEKMQVVDAFIAPPGKNEVTEDQLNSLRKKFNIPKNAFIVGGVGTIEWRKGSDLFVALAKIVCNQVPNVYFVWLGADAEVQKDMHYKLTYDVKTGLEDKVFFVSPDPEASKYYALFDVIAMVSREDPFPLVNLHAASFAKPILCFDKAGGSVDFVGTDCGFIVPFLDINEMAKKIISLQKDPASKITLGKNSQKSIDQ